MESYYGKFSLWVSWSKPVSIYRHQFIQLSQCSTLYCPRWEPVPWPPYDPGVLLCSEERIQNESTWPRSSQHVCHTGHHHMFYTFYTCEDDYQSCSDTFTQQLFFYNMTFVSLNPLIRLLNLNSARLVYKKSRCDCFWFQLPMEIVGYGGEEQEIMTEISQPCPLSCSYLISESKQWSFNQVILVQKPILWLFCYVNFLTDLI